MYAGKCRASILSKKYFARWKSNAWKLGLKRAARERRKNLSQSLKESVHRPVLDSEHFSKESSTPNAVVLASVSGGEPQQSPVKQVLNEGRSLLASMSLGGTKRKRESSESRMKVDEPQRLWQKHKRSNTLATSVMPASPSSNVHSRLRGDLVSTRAGDGSLLGDTLMRQARRLAPEMKSDTTRTDYFALKARGIDPNTPIVPRTKKRPRSTDDIQNQVGSRNEGSGRAVNLSNGCAVQSEILQMTMRRFLLLSSPSATHLLNLLLGFSTNVRAWSAVSHRSTRQHQAKTKRQLSAVSASLRNVGGHQQGVRSGTDLQRISSRVSVAIWGNMESISICKTMTISKKCHSHLQDHQRWALLR